MSTEHTQLIDKISHFIHSVGLQIEEGEIPETTFVPGIHIEHGTIWFNRSQLTYPGDLLHEAGHLALMEPDKRANATGDLEPGDGKTMNPDSLEVGVILWTWAALLHLNLDPRVVFHEEGYRGSSDWFIENFSSGNYIGLPLLQWLGLCKHQNATDEGIPEFPHMIKWLRS